MYGDNEDQNQNVANALTRPLRRLVLVAWPLDFPAFRPAMLEGSREFITYSPFTSVHFLSIRTDDAQGLTMCRDASLVNTHQPKSQICSIIPGKYFTCDTK